MKKTESKGSGYSFKGAKGTRYWFCPIQVSPKCLGWSNLLVKLYTNLPSILTLLTWVRQSKLAFGNYPRRLASGHWASGPQQKQMVQFAALLAAGGYN